MHLISGNQTNLGSGYSPYVESSLSFFLLSPSFPYSSHWTCHGTWEMPCVGDLVTPFLEQRLQRGQDVIWDEKWP